jgi:hypothetical protein
MDPIFASVIITALITLVALVAITYKALITIHYSRKTGEISIEASPPEKPRNQGHRARVRKA